MGQMAFTPVFNRKKKLQVQRLYLIEHWQPQEIAEKIGVTAKQVSELCKRQGWSKARKASISKIDKNTQSAEVALLEEHNEFSQSVRVRSMELVEKGMSMASETDSAKAFASLASGSKTFLDMYNIASGKQEAGGNIVNNTLNVMYINPEEPKGEGIVDI